MAGDPARDYALTGPPIPANNVRLITDADLGFAALDEEAIFLVRPDTNSVVDARHAAEDPDVDDLTTGEEYIAGTDPLLPGSKLSIEIAQGALRIPTVSAGETYSGRERYYSPIEAPNLTADPFQPIPGFQDLMGDGSVYVYPLPVGTNTARFYELEVDLN